MSNPSLINPADLARGLFERLPEPLLFRDAAPLAQMVDIGVLAAHLGWDDPQQVHAMAQAAAKREGVWPSDDAATLWAYLALEWAAWSDPSKRPARYQNTLCDQLREALCEMPFAERRGFVAALGVNDSRYRAPT